jgi:hypothetical protein
MTKKSAAALLAEVRKEMDHPREAGSVKLNALAHRQPKRKLA